MRTLVLTLCAAFAVAGVASEAVAAEVYVLADHALHRFDASTGGFVGTVGIYNQVSGADLQFGPDGLLHSQGDLGLWRINPGSGVGEEYIHFYTGGSPVTSTPGGFAVGPGSAVYVLADHALYHFNGATGALVSTIGTYSQVTGGDLQLGPDGLLYSLGDAGLWRIDPSSGAAVELITFFSGGSPVQSTPTGFTVNPQGVYIFSSHDLLKFNASSGAFLGPVGNYSQVRGDDLQFAPDGLLHALGDSGLWRINPGTGSAEEYLDLYSPGSPVQSTPGGFVVIPEPAGLVQLAALVFFTIRGRGTRSK